MCLLYDTPAFRVGEMLERIGKSTPDYLPTTFWGRYNALEIQKIVEDEDVFSV
jgi:hypothetical protein